MFEAFRLPRDLQRCVNNLSATVQVLLSEIVLHAEGLGRQQMRMASTEYEWALKTGKKYAEKIASDLDGLILKRGKRKADDVAIAVAAAAGRSTSEIAEFFGFERHYIELRLNRIRKTAANVAGVSAKDMEGEPDC